MQRPERAILMLGKRLRLLATVSVAGLFAFGSPNFSDDLFSGPSPAGAEEIQATNIFGDERPIPDEQLLLESDELVYDNDRSLVIAVGNVQIAYGRSTLVADRVEYNQQSGRVLAIGNVEILEPNGNRIFAQEIDITDDFSDGFISALNVSTPDNTRIAAESAERRDGEITSFNNGVYTACKACKENPEKPPFWQIRAAKVVVDNNTKTVSYEDASFEFFGRPVARLARFSHADPAIKRKSGFLIPGFSDDENLGFSYRQGYFMNLAPNYDLTVWGTYYDRQGFLGEAEWRHRLANGVYSIRYAGINQQDQNAFNPVFIDAQETDRHAVLTNGLFEINDRWNFGWNALFQTDDNFVRTYEIAGLNTRDFTNEVFLTGLGEKNYFNLAAQDFLVLDNRLDSSPDGIRLGIPFGLPGNQSFSDQQATVLPVLDYNTVSGEEYSMGQWSFDLNVSNIERSAPQIDNFDSIAGAPAANERFHGVVGNFTRASAELEWKASDISSGGLVTTASLSVRGDAMYQDPEIHSNPTFNILLTNDSIYRVMPAGMLEIRYPLIAQSGTTTHILEPIAQVIARPDETDIGEFVNEDAQSMVFDTTNLFERDKFSGFDRVEGGSRANVGFRYSASFESGASINVVAGQSFHLGGDNSFADTSDLVNAGNESGLETTRSDYVASLQMDSGTGFAAGVGVRLDEQDLGIKRSQVSARIVQPDYSFTGSYIFTEAQPTTRFIRGGTVANPTTPRDRHEIGGSASIRLDENWRVFGSMTYDLETESVVRERVGLGYDNDCFSFSVSYADSNGDFSGDSSGQSISFSLGLRTIGGFQHSVKIGDETN